MSLSKFLVVLTLLIQVPAAAHDREFMADHEKSALMEARQRAKSEGKMLMIRFHAHWCTPCVWMEQTSFKDPDILQILDKNYVHLIIDIEDPLSYDLKKLYEIKYLPTILLFDTEGQMLERIEQTLTPRKMKDVLEKHAFSLFYFTQIHQKNTSPKVIQKQMSEKRINVPDHVNAVDTKLVRLQAGVFENYQKVTEIVDILRQKSTCSILVHNAMMGEKVVFKIILGDFDSSEEALLVKEKLLKETGLDCILLT
jgi:thioredoxin-related protein